MRFTKIIFDFDHTLVQFGPHVDWRRAIQEIESIYLEEGIPLPVVEQSRGRGFQLMRTVYDYMLKVYPGERVREVQGRVFSALEAYELLGAEKAIPMDGAESLLRWLRLRGFQCAIVSSNGTAAVEKTLRHLGLSDFFAGVFGRDPTCRLKPYPDQNQACLASLGWQTEETVLVGDSLDDIESAKPLSIYTVGIVSVLARKEMLISAGADRLIQSLNELPSVLRQVDVKNVDR